MLQLPARWTFDPTFIDREIGGSVVQGRGLEGEYFNLRCSVFRCSPEVNIPIP